MTDKIEEQIGCGYCIHESKCAIYDPNTNKAKLGCISFMHHESVKELKKGVPYFVTKEAKEEWDNACKEWEAAITWGKSNNANI